MNFSNAPGEESFEQKYGSCYITNVDAIREAEYPMLQGMSIISIRPHQSVHNFLGTTYLDHAGTTLYPKSLLDAFSTDMISNLFGNPHSLSSSSQLSTQRIEDVRLRVLRFFNADPLHFDLIFVANATAGIKLVMDSFREEKDGFWFGYHIDSHTSLVGARECANTGQHCFESDEEVEKWLNDQASTSSRSDEVGIKLFGYPGQSNMNGRRLPLSWTGRLRSIRHEGSHVYSLLDAAALVSTSRLDLGDSKITPDFTVLSFNKMFGFPDLGALIVRKDAAASLRKRKYFGGGTVEIVTCGEENWHIRKSGTLHERLEDGTLPVHNIIALGSAMDVHGRIFGSFERVAAHTSFLADRLQRKLSMLRHCDGSNVCHMYKGASSSYSDPETQGPIIAFNLRSGNGEWISNMEVEKLANIRNIHLRSGGLCNPGGIASSLKLQPWEMKRNFSAGQRCGGENDIIGNKPTGAIRVSLGAMSSFQDVDTFVAFLEEFFVHREDLERVPAIVTSYDYSLYVESLTVYPIKSCGGWSIPSGTPWEVKEDGLAWDREWCLVHQGTRAALSQKKYPKMALLRPQLDLSQGVLRVRFHGLVPPATIDEITVPLSADPTVFDCTDLSFSQECGENIGVWTYRSLEIACFFTTSVGTPCTLARCLAAGSGTSGRHAKTDLTTTIPGRGLGSQSDIQKPIQLYNESPILLISRSSLNRLNEQIKEKGGKAAHSSVFRANIIVAEDWASTPRPEAPYDEDQWHAVDIGDKVCLDVLGGCRRCQMVCVDQQSAEKDQEPFVTLAKTRRREGKVFFGVHTALSNRHQGYVRSLSVGDRVVPLEAGG